jgi:hypothetical protein
MWAVLFRLADFGGHVEGSADVGRREVVGLEDLGEAKVAELDGVVMVEEDYTC